MPVPDIRIRLPSGSPSEASASAASASAAAARTADAAPTPDPSIIDSSVDESAHGRATSPAQHPAARALRVGVLLGVAFLAASVAWDLVVAPDHLERLWMWRVAGAFILVVCGALTYAVPHRAMWLGAVMSAASAGSIGAVVGTLPYGFAYGIGGMLLLAMGIGFVALDALAAGVAAGAAIAGGGTALWFGGASEDAILAIAFFLVPALVGAVIVAHVTALRVERNQMVRQELESLREDLARFGRTDELTGVHDERQLQQLARREVALARRRKSALSALKVGVQHLDSIKAEHGRSTGDETLRAVASMCQASLRETDLLARLGNGDVFAAVLPEADAEGAAIICARLKKSLENASVLADGKLLEIRVAVAHATLSDGDQSFEDLLKRADVTAKTNGA